MLKMSYIGFQLDYKLTECIALILEFKKIVWEVDRGVIKKWK